MIIIIFQTIILHTISQYTNLNLNTTTFGYISPTNMQYQQYIINIATIQSNSNYIIAQYKPQTMDSYVFSYMQLSQVPLSSNALIYSQMISDLYIDIQGYKMNKQQTVIVPVTALNNSNLYLYIFLSNYSITKSFNCTYNITISESQQIVCPNNCSLNGLCQSNGVCNCFIGNYGYDCSISPNVIYFNNNTVLSIYPTTYTYIKIFEYSNTMVLINTENTSSIINAVIYTQESDNCKYCILSPFNNEYSYELNNNFNDLSLTIKSVTWLLILNYGNQILEIQVVAEQIPRGQNQNMIVIIIVSIISGISLLVCAFIIYLYVKIRNQNLRIIDNKNYQSPTGLNPQELDKYFPLIEYQSFVTILESQEMKSQSSYNCVICLCNLQNKEMINVTYCMHFYHSDCFRSWITKEQNCPCCRQKFNKQLMNSIYEKTNNNEQSIKIEQKIMIEIVKLKSSKLIKKCLNTESGFLREDIQPIPNFTEII